MIDTLYAVVPTRWEFPEVTAKLLTTLSEDDVQTVVVDTRPDLDVGDDSAADLCLRVFDPDPPLNISRWWNRGLDMVAELSYDLGEYVVAILNDDVEVEPGFVRRLANAIETYDVAAAFPDVHGRGVAVINRVAQPISLYERMTGYAFALRGSLDLRADENMRWWYGDDDLDWRARRAGGCVMVAGLGIQHHHPSSWTLDRPDLVARTAVDREVFRAKWGTVPS